MPRGRIRARGASHAVADEGRRAQLGRIGRATIQPAMSSDAGGAARRRSCRARADRARARRNRGARDSATAAPRRCGPGSPPWNEHDGGNFVSEGFPAGIGRRRIAGDPKVHLQPFAALKARARSSIRSSGSSEADRQADRARADARFGGAPRRSCGSAWCSPGESPATSRRRRWRGAKKLFSASIKRRPGGPAALQIEAEHAPQPRGRSFFASSCRGAKAARIGDGLAAACLPRNSTALARVFDMALHAPAAAFRCPAAAGKPSPDSCRRRKSRRPSRRARRRNAATVDSSWKSMPWKPA